MDNQIKTAAGCALPAGAVPRENGVNFSIFSQNASKVQLLLFHAHSDLKPFAVIDFDENINRTGFYWHIFVYGIGAGVYYAYRIDGPRGGIHGGVFDFEKVLIDPYSRAVSMKRWERGCAIGPGDNLFKSMRSIVVSEDGYDRGAAERPGHKKSDLILYEAHPAGFTRSPGSETSHPGTFISFAQKAPYLKSLGINAVVMLPVMHFDDISALRYAPDGSPINNYWGNSSASFFAPHSSYVSSGGNNLHLNEFRDMVKAQHAAGIEVIIDVSLTHTDEGDSRGPIFCLKGVDNGVYYRLKEDDPALYENPIGCGNALNCSHPAVRRLIIDCLEFWADKMLVDGFRFDEAQVFMADEKNGVYKYSPLLWDMQYSQKLINSKFFIKNIDISKYEARYNFPRERWSFFNSDFKNDIRKFVKGESGLTSKVASRIAGSADIYEKAGYGPPCVINYITSHEGFTLNDLVSYNQKHNYENGEGNHDGADDNFSWNCSIEGPSDSESVENLRIRQIKNFAVILFVSQGVPVITAGDEVRRTQNGNNNAYCQNNSTGWFDWSLTEKNKDMLSFFTKLIEFRKTHDILRRRHYFDGALNARGLKDISWHACELDKPGFDDNTSRALAFTLGAADGGCDIHVIMNMYWEPLEFQLPLAARRGWYRVIDTFQRAPFDFTGGEEADAVKTPAVVVNGRSVAVFISK
jgi:glycogen operon protein